MNPDNSGKMGITKHDAPAVLEAPRRVTPKGLASMRDHSIPTTTEDTTEEIPYGYCQCGCGQKTSISKTTDRHKGAKRGKPRRYVAGHHPNGRSLNLPDPNPSGLCQCGCGEATPVAKRTYAKKGIVQGYHVRFCVGHKPMRALADRFWEKVDRGSLPNGCWLWKGSRNEHGYGQLNGGRVGAGMIKAHRLAYEIEKGPIPEGLVIDHLCRNPQCVNPDHLEPVTPAENTRRGAECRRLEKEIKQIDRVTITEATP